MRKFFRRRPQIDLISQRYAHIIEAEKHNLPNDDEETRVRSFIGLCRLWHSAHPVTDETTAIFDRRQVIFGDFVPIWKKPR